MKAIKNIVLCIALLVPCLAQATITRKKIYQLAEGIKVAGGCAMCAGYGISILGMLIPEAILATKPIYKNSGTVYRNEIENLGFKIRLISLPFLLVGLLYALACKYYMEKDDIEECAVKQICPLKT